MNNNTKEQPAKTIWFDKPYNNFNSNMRERFGKKVVRLSIDAGFSCPNRDGKISTGGCIFCSEKGSGEFSGDSNFSIKTQMNNQIQLISSKWNDNLYLAYFQSFSNTYSDVDTLKIKFEQALSFPNVIGLAIATRADCINDDVINLLSDLSKKTYILIEMGLQSVYNEHHNFLNTGYTKQTFIDSATKLSNIDVDVVAHFILGLPNTPKSNEDDIIKFINNSPISGIKIHMLNILKGTKLADFYHVNPFNMLSMNEYLEKVLYIIERIDPNIVVHRFTGDGAKDLLIEPNWILNKRKVLNTFTKMMKDRNTYQGKLYKN